MNNENEDFLYEPSQSSYTPIINDSSSFKNQDENQNPNIIIINNNNTNKDLKHEIPNIESNIPVVQDILSQNIDSNSKTPSQFRDFIFWPKENISSKKRAPKVKMPSVLSSEEGLRLYSEQEEKKRKIEEEKELKKKLRAEKSRVKKEEAERKKQLKNRYLKNQKKN